MKLESLAVFLEVARLGSFSGAAHAMHLTPQAVSSSMRRLEATLDVPLFSPSSRGLCLTAQGRELLAFAKGVVPAWAELENRFRSRQESRLRGRLLVYVNNSFYLERLFHIVERFCTLHPGVSVVTSAHGQAEIRERLLRPCEEGVSRIGLLNIPCMSDDGYAPDFCQCDGLEFHPLVRARYHACMSKGHPFARRRRITLKRLLKEPLIVATAGDPHASPLYHLLSRHGVPNIVLATSSLTVWRHAIAHSLGIGFLHDIFLDGAEPFRTCLEEMAVVPVLETMAAVTGYLLKGEPGDIVRTFISFLPEGQQGAKHGSNS